MSRAGGPLLGPRVERGGTRFGAFVTSPEALEVRIFDESGVATVTARFVGLSPLAWEAGGGEGAGIRDPGRAAEATSATCYREAFVPRVGEGARYKLALGAREVPDPFARWLPEGVHGPAVVTGASRFDWRNGPGLARPLREQILYEVHVGTFTPEGTYRAAAAKLPLVAQLGVTTIELMPLSAFPGARGWGYDGVAHFAPHAPYGTPDELRAFVDEAHGLGLSVLLDVVYNHFGPSGSYLGVFSETWFRHDVKTPWGDALDYRTPAMRQYVLENARYWLEEFRFDGLRLDAISTIVDDTRPSVLAELAGLARALVPPKLLVAEDDRNGQEVVTELGLSAVWADDFHHQAHVVLTGERDGYYRAYRSDVRDLARVIERGWLYEGQVFEPWGRPRGGAADALEAEAFVYCLQNHDQIGNRARGERLHSLVSLEAYLAVSTLLLLLPTTPLLFMGQEWGASAPFLYFTDHEPELGAAVTRGRREEFAGFAGFADPHLRERIPDPQAESTFLRSKLDWQERGSGQHGRVLEVYRRAIELRRGDPVLREVSRRGLRAWADGDLLVVTFEARGARRALVVSFSDAETPVPEPLADLEVLFETRASPPGLVAPRAARFGALDAEERS